MVDPCNYTNLSTLLNQGDEVPLPYKARLKTEALWSLKAHSRALDLIYDGVIGVNMKSPPYLKRLSGFSVEGGLARAKRGAAMVEVTSDEVTKKKNKNKNKREVNSTTTMSNNNNNSSSDDLRSLALRGTHDYCPYDELAFPNLIGRLLNLTIVTPPSNAVTNNNQQQQSISAVDQPYANVLFEPYSEVIKSYFLNNNSTSDDDEEEEENGYSLVKSLIDVANGHNNDDGYDDGVNGLVSPWKLLDPIISELYYKLNPTEARSDDAGLSIRVGYFRSVYNSGKFQQALRLTSMEYLEKRYKA